MPKGREARVAIAEGMSLLGLWSDCTTRVRRGMIVVVPDEWAGHVTHPRSIQNRQSKSPRKARNRRTWDAKGMGRMDLDRQQSLELRLGPDFLRRGHEVGHPRNWPERLTPHRLRQGDDE